MGVLAGWTKGLGAGEDEEVWSQMRDYWVATGQLSPERAEAIGVDTEDAFREMGLWASWGHGSGWDLQAGTADQWWSDGAGEDLAVWGNYQTPRGW